MSSEEKKTIIVIDDDITIRKLISHHLLLNNYKVIQAKDADEGFTHLKGNSIDLVLCDVMLGEMDGFTFCQKVRENGNHRLTPFVFVTAKNTFEDKARAMDVGGDDIITKPFDVNELILKVKALLKRSQIYKQYGAKKSLENSFTEEKTKIVLIDDDISLAKLFQYNLNKEGFDCALAYTADEGLRIIKMISPDIIICDIMMPGSDGFQLRRTILEDHELSPIPFIFLTAKAAEKSILEGYDLDITDYILKTSSPKVIVAKITAIIKSLGKERRKAVLELHDAADSIRARVVPENNPEFDGFDIEHWHVPYSGIPGGDFIDYFRLDENNLAIVLGDVMGKRWGAWYFAFAYAGYIRSSLRSVFESVNEFLPSKILERVNKSVYNDAKISEVFTTISIIVLNKKNKIAYYSGAGDLPILYKEGISGKVSKIQSDGTLLGFSERTQFYDYTINLNSTDLIILTTDGVTESRNSSKEQFGTSRIINVLSNSSNHHKPLDIIKKDFSTFTGGIFEDDVSIISISVK
jgi:phosphoserine phosphatase RsbU/P